MDLKGESDDIHNMLCCTKYQNLIREFFEIKQHIIKLSAMKESDLLPQFYLLCYIGVNFIDFSLQ